jgi:drug/metabolite transporter (DMT)-like permease
MVGIRWALLAAILFGLSTPFAKMLSLLVNPITLAGLIYLGAGIGLGTWLFVSRIFERHAAHAEAPLLQSDLPWLAGAIITGGIVAPILLLAGLMFTPASAASLMLNMETALTVLLAWFVFKEGFGCRVFMGVLLIIAAGAVLSWSASLASPIDNRPAFWGPIAIAGACLAWGIDNNLTRKISSGDPVQVAAIKGLVAGAFNLVLSFALGARVPRLGTILISGTVGLFGYGLSIVFFVLSLRHLGVARTSAYFAVAPFVGAFSSLLIFAEPLTPQFMLAVPLMAAGICFHLAERHVHEHAHDEFAHGHRHTHDEHHKHWHAREGDAGEPHSHEHLHRRLVHSHPHYPDIHHRHGHQDLRP